MDLKQPLTYEEQLNRLEEHGLIIDADKTEYYKEILEKVNYYRFTGYALQFRVGENESDFVSGTTFEQIYEIYLFDEELRNLLREYIEIAEIYYRSEIAYNFSLVKCKNPPHDQHYDERNYCNKKGFREVMDTFQKEKNYYKDSLIVKHHKNKYSGKMPLWVIVELMSFSNISKLYNAMYYSEKDVIANAVGTGRGVLENNLHCLSVLRNKCAHAAKLYNTDYNPPATLPVNFLRKNPSIKNNSLFAYFLVLLRRLPDENYRKDMYNEIVVLLDKYRGKINLDKIGFPENYKELIERNI